jgi:RimJ/RimL family protein N-acetyltransferase/predicted GNAT family N-acyltransferase
MVDAIREFRRRFQQDVAEHVVPAEHGLGLVMPSYPQVYDENFLWVEAPAVGAAELARAADTVLEHCFHRRVIVSDGSPGLSSEFASLGFGLSTHLVLAHQRAPDRRADTAMVAEVSLEELLPLRTLSTLREPWGDDEIARQLNGTARLISAAMPTRYFAARVDGEIAGACEVYARGGVAQIENVEVNAEFRGRGLGRAIVQHALDEAQQDAGLVFLEALADDWPRELYARLGFVTVDRLDFYTRLPDPLSRLRLRTPRLELRLATRAEARRLFEVAEAGIHDPTVMPFEIPWTDALDEEDFVSHVTGSTTDSIRFVVFLDGAPIGVQAVDVEPESISTGSWLGRSYQGRGLGTEMRAAVLTYAFDVRQAPLARSGAIAGNPQSLGVSRKLGYEVVGTQLVSPRDSPVELTDVELRRERFHSPVPVAVDGVSAVA